MKSKADSNAWPMVWGSEMVDPSITLVITLAEAEALKVQANIEMNRRGNSQKVTKPRDISLFG